MGNPSCPGALLEASEKTANLISLSEKGLSNQLLFSKERVLADQEEKEAASELSEEYKRL